MLTTAEDLGRVRFRLNRTAALCTWQARWHRWRVGDPTGDDRRCVSQRSEFLFTVHESNRFETINFSNHQAGNENYRVCSKKKRLCAQFFQVMGGLSYGARSLLAPLRHEEMALAT
jgi:hypothetical protein